VNEEILESRPVEGTSFQKRGLREILNVLRECTDWWQYAEWYVETHPLSEEERAKIEGAIESAYEQIALLETNPIYLLSIEEFLEKE
jgi:hypothetical protein